MADSEKLLRPSIACYGVDSTDENYLIGFLRTGPNQFPDVSAINYDSTGWSIVPTTVQNGFGLIDLRQDLVAPWDSMERLGDYTCIQRRYNDPYRRCWMVGAHAFGLGANHFGRVSGVNAWIAELGDSLPALDATASIFQEHFSLHPNPSSKGQTVTLELPSVCKGNVLLFDAVGNIRHSEGFNGKRIEISPAGLMDGIYFVKVDVIGRNYVTQKIIVRD